MVLGEPQADELLSCMQVLLRAMQGDLCANCEQQTASLFCNTCDQPLCADCKATAHSAKMFAKHGTRDGEIKE